MPPAIRPFALLCLLIFSATTASTADRTIVTTPKTRQAFQALKPLAEEGNPTAQYEMGTMYRTGKGAPQDFKQAARWFRKAADQGMPEAQNNLGGLYVTGQGVERDYVQAYKWFSLAASRGLADGRSNRDKLAAEMPPDQIAKGKKLARHWKVKERPPK